MTKFIDLSHIIENDMPGFRVKNEDGTTIQYSASISPFLTHEESAPKYNNLASFEITQIEFQTSIGTYLDSPYHRFPNKRSIFDIQIKEVILPGVVVDASFLNPKDPLELDQIGTVPDVSGKAVLFNFGWDQYWGHEEYYQYPFLGESVIDYLVQQEVNLVGVDTINIDDSHNLARPAHTKFLYEDIFIVENLCKLDLLYDQEFRFFAVPLKVKQAAAMPIRAFAEVN